ncbi:MAG: 3-isopropylmalate dehydrogenase [Firmicutes bacterium]|jgi:3-isopropylmalate dehydrogenase|nr:3-isopropylmalate dehydrogenase [Bacillota bacterium]
MNESTRIALLSGDGIGPEVVREAVRALETVGEVFGHKFQFMTGLIGGAAIDAAGTPLPRETLELCRSSRSVILGAVGGPRWEGLPGPERPEAGLLGLRKGLGVFANLRPVRVLPCMAEASTLKRETVQGVDLVVVRELTGGLYFGTPRGRSGEGPHTSAVDTMVYSRHEIERVARVAFNLAAGRRKTVTSVDKANVLECSRLWREVVQAVAAEYPGVQLSHMYVDNMAMQLVRNPRQFDVVLTENMFGDILSDEAAMLPGSLGMLPSASLGLSGPGLYEPIHGSAPDIAGRGVANPIAAILSAAMLLRHSLCLINEARAVEHAVERVLNMGYRTPDIWHEGATQVGTEGMGSLIAREIERMAPSL